MKLAALFSGGKDSTFAIYSAKKQNHEIACLLSIITKSDESHLLHHPNMRWTVLQSKSLGIPQLVAESSDSVDENIDAIKQLLQKAISDYHIDGLVHGGISSEFQKTRFESLCSELAIKCYSPLWHKNPLDYMKELIATKFNFIITSVSSDGLDDRWLGKPIGNKELDDLVSLSRKYGFNLHFEGGEAETFVTNCPLFSKSIIIKKSVKKWDGYRGRFEILEAELDNNA